MISLVRRFVQDERGQATIEWTILALSMAVIAMWIVYMVGNEIKDFISAMLEDLRG